MNWFIPVIAVLFLADLAAANDQIREWALESGEKIQAEITGFDEVARIVTLQSPDGKTIKIAESNFTTIDRAWILEWMEQFEEAQALLSKIGGTVTRHTTKGAFATTYSVYVPATEPDASGAKPPLLFLFHPGGHGGRVIYRYIEAAASLGVTLVSFDHFQNTDNNPEREAEMLQRFTAILPQIEAAVPHDENRMFMGGVSGGAWRAFHYSAQVPRPWAGILSIGGWLGGEEWFDLPYPRLRVAMVYGDKDHARRVIEKDTEILHQSGSIVSVHAFEGGHQMSPPSVTAKALRWLLETKLPVQTAP
jgi:predicted esterase